jgi:hypothetical protein
VRLYLRLMLSGAVGLFVRPPAPDRVLPLPLPARGVVLPQRPGRCAASVCASRFRLHSSWSPARRHLPKEAPDGSVLRFL